VRNSAKRYRSIFLISCGVTLALGLLHCAFFDPLRKAEAYSQDLRHCWGRKAALDPRLVFLAIDKASVQLDSLFPDEIEASPALKMMKAGYPWSREVYSLLAERLIEAGARLVIFDLLFPAQGSGDEAFRGTLNKYPGQILIGCDFVVERTAAGIAWRLDLPSETLLERKRPIDPRLGFVTFWSDPDGPVRHVRMTTSLEELSGNQKPPEEIFESLETRTLRRLNRPDLIRTGQDIPFRFVGGPHTIRPHPVYQIFVPDLWSRNFQDGKFFKDKIVFVGPEGSWSHDEHATPFRVINGDEALMPGPEIHLNALNAALRSEFLMPPPRQVELAVFAFAGICGMLLSLPRGPLWRSIATVIWFGLFGNVAVVLYNQIGLLLPVAVPSAIVVSAVVINIIGDYRTERREKAEIRSTLGHYVGESIVGEVLANPAAFLHSLAGVRRTVTILFSDLRGFTRLTAERSPTELVAQLNEYFSAMTDQILEHGGTIDKFMGDGLMAVWGNLRTQAARENVKAALRAALGMRSTLQMLNRGWQERGWPVLKLGIALAHGDATIGNIGSSRKMEFTAIGNVVNAASRIERIAAETGRDILVEERTAKLATDTFDLHDIGSFEVKGGAYLNVFYLAGEKDQKLGAVSTGDSSAVTEMRKPEAALRL
jgi:adenylate cyclase